MRNKALEVVFRSGRRGVIIVAVFSLDRLVVEAHLPSFVRNPGRLSPMEEGGGLFSVFFGQAKTRQGAARRCGGVGFCFVIKI